MIDWIFVILDIDIFVLIIYKINEILNLTNISNFSKISIISSESI